MNDSGRGGRPDADPLGSSGEDSSPEGSASSPGDSGDQGGADGAPAGTQQAGTQQAGTQQGSTQQGSTQQGSGLQGSAPKARRRRRKRSFWRELPILVAVALVLAVVIKAYALQAFFIPSGSMENTLDINDRVLINKLVYDFRGIHRGDIVVFNGDGSWDPGTVPTSSNFVSEFFSNFAGMFGFGHPGDIYVKRVIGLPGDRVACCDAEGRVTVNGVPLSEGTYLYPGDAPSLVRFNIVVPPGQLWVMGDHRSVSDDSRGHLGDPGGGTIPESAVLGRAFVIIWPPSRWRILPIPATFEQTALSKQATTADGTGNATESAAVTELLGTRLAPSGPALPLSLGFAAAVPLTWLQRRVRLRAERPAKRRRGLARRRRRGSA
jgi:signal peptidase I